MYQLFTFNVAEWLDALQSRHQLPLEIITYQPQRFFSNVTAGISQTVAGVTHATVVASGYHGRYFSQKARDSNQAFLFTHSVNHFCGSQQQRNFSGKRISFCIDLSKNFDGYFHGVGLTHSVIIPFDLLDDKIVDFLKKTPLSSSRFYLAIDTLLRDISSHAQPMLIESKIRSLINLVSMCDLNSSNSTSLQDIYGFYLEKLHERSWYADDKDNLSLSLIIDTAKLHYDIHSTGSARRSYMQSMHSLRVALAKNAESSCQQGT